MSGNRVKPFDVILRVNNPALQSVASRWNGLLIPSIVVRHAEHVVWTRQRIQEGS
jgi:hypothetical protein